MMTALFITYLANASKRIESSISHFRFIICANIFFLREFAPFCQYNGNLAIMDSYQVFARMMKELIIVSTSKNRGKKCLSQEAKSIETLLHVHVYSVYWSFPLLLHRTIHSRNFFLSAFHSLIVQVVTVITVA